MRILSLCVLLFTLALLPSCGDDDNPSSSGTPGEGITGTWVFAFSAYPGASFTAQITQSGSTFSGSGSSPAGGSGTVTGTVAGSAVQVTIQVASSVCPGTRQFSYPATLGSAGNVITSTGTVQGYDCNGTDWQPSNFGIVTMTRR